MSGLNGPTDVVVGGVMDSYRWVRDFCTAVKHGKVKPFTPLERKVREATRNEPWGPTGTMLNELAEISFDEHDCYVIFAVVDFRLGYPPDKWRNVYKGLAVLDFILKRGSDTWVTLTTNELVPKLTSLEEFEYIDEKGKDQGINVRHKAAAIRALLSSPRVLEAERESAKKKRQQYKGYARSDMQSERRYSDDGLTFSRKDSNLDDDGWGTTDDIGYGRLHANGGSLKHGELPAAPKPDMPRGQRAGEMKGVTLEENKRNLAELKEILNRPENRQCADCAGASSSRPTWASINNGVFICMQCAGVHRGLGVHISQVRSCTLDTWLPHQISFLSQTGNAIANSYWEGKMPPTSKPTSGDSHALGSFIRLKYAGEWALGTWPPETREPEPSSFQPVAALQRSSAQSGPSQDGSFWGGSHLGSTPPQALQIASSASVSGFEDDFWGGHKDVTAASPHPARAMPVATAAKPPSQPVTVGSFWDSAPPAQAALPRQADPQPTQPVAPTVRVATSSGSFWESAGAASPSHPDPHQPQPRALAPPPAPAPAPASAPTPAQAPLMFDLLSFDDEPAPAPAQAQPPSAEVDLLSLFDSPAPPPAVTARPALPVAAPPRSSLLPPPTVPLYSENSQMPLGGAASGGVSSDLLALQELAGTPANLMDIMAMPIQTKSPGSASVANPAQSAGPGSFSLPENGSNLGPAESMGSLDFKYEVQQTGSVVHGLDDLLSYQYTGADCRPNTRLQAPMRNSPTSLLQPRAAPAAGPPAFSLGGQSSAGGVGGSFWGSSSGAAAAATNRARSGLGSAGPVAGSQRPAGLSSWQAQPSSGSGAAKSGVTAFDALQEDFLGAYNIPSPQRGSKGSNKPMRAG